MVLLQEQDSVECLLRDTIMTVCRSTVTFQSHMMISGQVTLSTDKDAPFCINLDCLVKVEGISSDEFDPDIPNTDGTPEHAECDEEGDTNCDLQEDKELDEANNLLLLIKKEIVDDTSMEKSCQEDDKVENAEPTKPSPPQGRRRGRPGRKPRKKPSKAQKVGQTTKMVKSEKDPLTDDPSVADDAVEQENYPDYIKEETKSKPKKNVTNMNNILQVGSLFKCKLCEFTKKNKYAVRKHLAVHERPKLVCYYCEETFTDKFRRNKHVKAAHDGEKPWCDVCKKRFASVASISLHKRKMHHTELELEGGESGKEMLKCAGCGSLFVTLCNLEKHMKQTTCETCQKAFVCKNELKSHMNAEHPVEAKLRQCEYCQKVLSSKTGMYQHKQLFHGQQIDPEKFNEFTCHICGKSFPLYDYLKRHLRSHDASYEPYECPKCHKRFKYHRNCKTHKEGCMNEAGYQCHLCGKKLKNDYCLREHVRNMHSNERKHTFPCRRCGLLFSYSGSRSKHEKTCNSVVQIKKELLRTPSPEPTIHMEPPQMFVEIGTDKVEESDLQVPSQDDAVEQIHVFDGDFQQLSYETIAAEVSRVTGLNVVQIPGDLQSGSHEIHFVETQDVL